MSIDSYYRQRLVPYYFTKDKPINQIQKPFSVTEWAIISSYLVNDDLEAALDLLESAHLSNRSLNVDQFRSLLAHLDKDVNAPTDTSHDRLLYFLIYTLQHENFDAETILALSSTNPFSTLDNVPRAFWSTVDTLVEESIKRDFSIIIWYHILLYLYQKDRLASLATNAFQDRGARRKFLASTLLKLQSANVTIGCQVISLVTAALTIGDADDDSGLVVDYCQLFLNDLYELISPLPEARLEIFFLGLLPLTRLDLCLMFCERKFQLGTVSDTQKAQVPLVDRLINIFSSATSLTAGSRRRSSGRLSSFRNLPEVIKPFLLFLLHLILLDILDIFKKLGEKLLSTLIVVIKEFFTDCERLLSRGNTVSDNSVSLTMVRHSLKLV